MRFVKDINICSDLETTIITIQDMNGKESRYKLKAGTEIKLNVNVGETTMTFTGIELKD
ncbi:MAG: hypothetical protein HFJ17_02060 [Clostridia bacterium]|nr:hypothetical protein [Clostridia bacterium]